MGKAADNATCKGERLWHNYITPSDLSAESGESGAVFLIFNNTAFSGCYKSFGH